MVRSTNEDFPMYKRSIWWKDLEYFETNEEGLILAIRESFPPWKKVEVHRIMERYRGILRQFQEKDRRGGPVEFRKLENSCVNFINQVPGFYCCLIR